MLVADLFQDAVGGYLVCLGQEIVLGQAVPGADVDVPIFGNLARRHGVIRRDAEGYIVTPEAEMTVVALEYGTQPTPLVRLALRADNWLHHHGDLASPQGRAITAQIRAVFYPDAVDWREAFGGGPCRRSSWRPRVSDSIISTCPRRSVPHHGRLC